MSSSVQNLQNADITQKWELAQRLSGHAKAPEQALKPIFQGSIEYLEKRANTKFETSMKERVWVAVSKDRLKILQDTLMQEFCEKILGSFNETEVSTMLEEHKQTGSIQNMEYSAMLQTAYHLHHSSIIDAVVQKAESMTTEWIPEIVAAVQDNSLEFLTFVSEEIKSDKEVILAAVQHR